MAHRSRVTPPARRPSGDLIHATVGLALLLGECFIIIIIIAIIIIVSSIIKFIVVFLVIVFYIPSYHPHHTHCSCSGVNVMAA